jgi:hypothetical protein
MTVWPFPYTTQPAISDVKISLSDKEKVRSIIFIFNTCPLHHALVIQLY